MQAHPSLAPRLRGVLLPATRTHPLGLLPARDPLTPLADRSYLWEKSTLSRERMNERATTDGPRRNLLWAEFLLSGPSAAITSCHAVTGDKQPSRSSRTPGTHTPSRGGYLETLPLDTSARAGIEVIRFLTAILCSRFRAKGMSFPTDQKLKGILFACSRIL